MKASNKVSNCALTPNIFIIKIMQDEHTKNIMRSKALKSLIAFYVEQETYLQQLIAKNRTLEPTYQDKWNAIQTYLLEILKNRYACYFTGIPTLEDCKIKVHIKTRSKEEITSGISSPVYRWFLHGPKENNGAIHRQVFDVTCEGTYCCSYPDPLLCSWLAEKGHVKQLLEN
jgi:hypothetical protein